MEAVEPPRFWATKVKAIELPETGEVGDAWMVTCMSATIEMGMTRSIWLFPMSVSVESVETIPESSSWETVGTEGMERTAVMFRVWLWRRFP